MGGARVAHGGVRVSGFKGQGKAISDDMQREGAPRAIRSDCMARGRPACPLAKFHSYAFMTLLSSAAAIRVKFRMGLATCGVPRIGTISRQ